MSKHCAVDGCDRADIQGHDLCRMHYIRWYRTGTTEVRRPQRAQRGICTIDGCEKVDAGPHGLCPMHKTRSDRNGSPTALRGPNVMRGVENPNWTGDEASYSAMHMRVKKSRGSAALNKCVDCRKDAAHWSYDRQDPDERSGIEGPYSVHIQHYVPRCVSCHKRFDLGARRATA